MLDSRSLTSGDAPVNNVSVSDERADRRLLPRCTAQLNWRSTATMGRLPGHDVDDQLRNPPRFVPL